MNKKRKLILNIWIIFIVIILLILLFLLGLRLPKLFKSIKDKNKVETQSQYQTQYIYDTNKVNDIIGLINSLKRLKTLKQFEKLKNKQQEQEQQKATQSINNLDFFDYNVQNDFVPSKVPSDDNNQLVKDIAVVSSTTGVVVISCLVLKALVASLAPQAAPLVAFA